jgi:hypothetical protein
MRIVPNLNEVKGCPNCQNNILVIRINDFGRPYLFCHDCHEEIYENETTCSEEQHAVYCVKKIANAKEDWLNQKRKEKENFIFEMREEISNLTWTRPDPKTQILVENIQNILNRIIDYIEEN